MVVSGSFFLVFLEEGGIRVFMCFVVLVCSCFSFFLFLLAVDRWLVRAFLS